MHYLVNTHVSSLVPVQKPSLFKVLLETITNVTGNIKQDEV